MTAFSHEIKLRTNGNNDIHDLTGRVAQALKSSGIADGIVTVFVPGSTAGITTIEMERGMVRDLKRWLDTAVPKDAPYEHNHGGDTNGHAHVRAAILGPNVSVPISDGSMQLGTWQQIVLVDCDTGPRERTVIVQIVGD
ncbi:MAG: secondary thiamine-phosphate synthase enzyme YjbQ [Actinomycetota bacterium]